MIDKLTEKYLDDLSEKKDKPTNDNIDVSREVRVLSQRIIKETTVEGKLNIIGGLILLSCASSCGNKSLTQLALKLGKRTNE